jgi:hypothetical protein
MRTQQDDKKHASQKSPERPERNAVIGEHVLSALGRPNNLHCVQVRRLWDDHYRVNVFVGKDAACATVAHSYFLVADSDGTIVESTPKVAKCYQ